MVSIKLRFCCVQNKMRDDMEFHEKLQELRKRRGITQEELAEALYVSRTAISKWESGRGYPGIESLKRIADFYSVTIDELLSGEKLISIAEKENKTNIRSMCDFVFGIADVCFLLLIVLPLYPRTIEEYIYSVSLFAYAEITAMHRLIYWILLALLIVSGIIKLVLTKFKSKTGQKLVTDSSMIINIMLVVFLALTREPYAVTLAFLLLVMKGMLLIKCR